MFCVWIDGSSMLPDRGIGPGYAERRGARRCPRQELYMVQGPRSPLRRNISACRRNEPFHFGLVRELARQAGRRSGIPLSGSRAPALVETYTPSRNRHRCFVTGRRHADLIHVQRDHEVAALSDLSRYTGACGVHLSSPIESSRLVSWPTPSRRPSST